MLFVFLTAHIAGMRKNKEKTTHIHASIFHRRVLGAQEPSHLSSLTSKTEI